MSNAQRILVISLFLFNGYIAVASNTSYAFSYSIAGENLQSIAWTIPNSNHGGFNQELLENDAAGNEFESPSKGTSGAHTSVFESRDSALNDNPGLDNGQFSKTAKLNLIDKSSGVVSEITLVTGEPTFLDNRVSVELLSCWTSSLQSVQKDHRALVKAFNISAVLQDISLVYNGWLLSQHPYVTNIHHDKYALILLSCK